MGTCLVSSSKSGGCARFCRKKYDRIDKIELTKAFTRQFFVKHSNLKLKNVEKKLKAKI